MKLDYYIAYLRFLIMATNQHGVHSPFVYRFITRCLYLQTPHKDGACERLILKMIPYFGIRRIQLCPPNNKVHRLISLSYPDVVFDNPPYDLIYREAADITTKGLSGMHKEQVHHDSVIVIRGIHKNRQAATRWKRLIQSGRFTVSIDLFHCGMLFFRTGLAVQHFKIRI